MGRRPRNASLPHLPSLRASPTSSHQASHNKHRTRTTQPFMTVHRISVRGTDRTQQVRRGTDRTQQVRRRIYASQIAANLSRLRSSEIIDRQRAQRPANEPNENVMDHLTGSLDVFQDNEQEDRSDINAHEGGDETEQAPVWVDLIEEQPDEIDDLIAADKERHLMIPSLAA
ncbi:hypothetical protein PGTUg99_031619 [Puccinia graminis f. sp. tritici]|uniref:Uncharacterized protein n=1 Tax=Puccinia graminis f. sp. tritici TaxID=56615 RepID=A0A5B0S7R5_PUCGR|nr:hypothetical protein PGTUg99_031619 [Puccinia graminis f. sp. tritici]